MADEQQELVEIPCDACLGQTHWPCGHCGGTGSATCKHCHGTGQDSCLWCEGTGCREIVRKAANAT